MLIQCMRCTRKFEQKTSERLCGFSHYVVKKLTKEQMQIRNQQAREQGYHEYLSKSRRYHQDPIYQWYKEFITTEQMPRHQSNFMNLLVEEYLNHSIV